MVENVNEASGNASDLEFADTKRSVAPSSARVTVSTQATQQRATVDSPSAGDSNLSSIDMNAMESQR
eukprot:CAMPEP_0185579964 /NCGR_PEP_ID=MMETSP0434-20130131/15516_1 /TAXON_ID=626734 ORGANISM="Favella taraikaensis, Strain Fe Narragansett Bay" /NCGR_SAMPLE_ID=MMETSP0434 /ASSEMBLY_ACC=CAM_ASM_000379 /LENGTH=66 /DNA_ID=CAMNT_0028198089 /DNA_START=12 /DNA_END=212 /DNA_ORIENTATION=-